MKYLVIAARRSRQRTDVWRSRVAEVKLSTMHCGCLWWALCSNGCWVFSFGNKRPQTSLGESPSEPLEWRHAHIKGQSSLRPFSPQIQSLKRTLSLYWHFSILRHNNQTPVKPKLMKYRGYFSCILSVERWMKTFCSKDVNDVVAFVTLKWVWFHPWVYRCQTQGPRAKSGPPLHFDVALKCLKDTRSPDLTFQIKKAS